MSEIIGSTDLLFVFKTFGTIGLLFALTLVLQIADNKRMIKWRDDELAERRRLADVDRQERKDDAVEHMRKWDTMIELQAQQMASIITSHREDNERLATVLKRMAEASELHAHLLTVVDQQIKTNQWCPMTRNPKEPR